MISNLYEDIPEKLTEELFTEIIKGNEVKVERIVSEGHCSPQDFWYDQERNELVFLLKGCTEISFDDSTSIKLYPGDYINIPARRKHKVVHTDKNQKTIWLAIYYK